MWHLISETYKRWRHTRGYGVHSPFAYSLVKEVVRPGRKYGHYGYEEIDNSLERTSLPHPIVSSYAPPQITFLSTL